MILPRLIRLRDAPAYLGVDRNRFNAEIRPTLTEVPTAQCHLMTHLRSTKMQTDACISCVQPLLDGVQPLCHPPPHLPGG